MATLEKKSPTSLNKLPHQQSLPTPQAVAHHQLLQQQLSQPVVQSKSISNGESMQVSNEQQSDNSSLYSVELEPLNECEHRYIDSDPGFGSMSSSEQAQLSNNQLIRQNQISVEQQEVHQKEVEDFKQEITKLKCDKLDLLRQNVVSCADADNHIKVLTQFPFSHLHRHVNVISSDSESVNFHFKATFRQRAKKFCDSVNCFKNSQHRPATAPSLPIRRQCCRKCLILCFYLLLNEKQPKRHKNQGNLMLCNQKTQKHKTNSKS